MPPLAIGLALLILSGVGLSLTLFTHRWPASKRWKFGVTFFVIGFFALLEVMKHRG